MGKRQRRQRRTGLARGLLGGVVGLAAMEVIRRATAPLVKDRAPSPYDVLPTERSMSPFGLHHEPGESATTAIGRIAYQQLLGRPPSERMSALLSWGVHLGYGLVAAAAFGALRGARAHHVVRDGLAFGSGLWLLGDELTVPLLGLADKPTAYHPTRHLQSLAQHLGFGVATAATARALAQRAR
ncbi:MAG: hypothetical protein KF773_21570 [Deltaproteobacteria bacterium]|nr:hypothetical protein [Deltaproteobacteria bacterium]